MALTKMKILAYQDNTFSTKVSSGTYYAVINPKNWSESYTIELSNSTPQGAPTTERKFLGIKPSTMDMTLYFDGTGLVSTITSSEKSKTVYDQVTELKKLIYGVDGQIHQPNYLRIIWGKMRFEGRVNSMNIEYSLIDPEGNPIRGNVRLGLTSSENLKSAEKDANNQSPDMSHMLETKAGSVLPLMCNTVYQNPDMYIGIARHNDLDQFRQLPNGIQLDFPPLES